MWKENLLTNEDIPRIKKWAYEFANYIPYEKGPSEIPYYKQSIEIDANAFGLCFLNIDSQKDDKLSLITRMPNEIDDLLHKRIAEIMEMNFARK